MLKQKIIFGILLSVVTVVTTEHLVRGYMRGDLLAHHAADPYVITTVTDLSTPVGQFFRADDVEFRVEMGNIAVDHAENVVMTNTVPPEFDILSVTPTGSVTCDHVDNVVTCSAPRIDGGQSETVTILTRIWRGEVCGTTAVNRATIVADSNTVQSNDIAEDFLRVESCYDVRIELDLEEPINNLVSRDVEGFAPNQVIRFNVTARNYGDLPVAGVQRPLVKWVFDNGFSGTFQWEGARGYGCIVNQDKWLLPNLDARGGVNDSALCTYNDGTISTKRIHPLNRIDFADMCNKIDENRFMVIHQRRPVNHTDLVGDSRNYQPRYDFMVDHDFPITCIDIETEKTLLTPDVPAINIGDPVEYQVTVRNDYADPAPSVTVFDDIPNGIIVSSATPTSGTCTVGANVNCDLGDIAPGTSETITIQGSVEGSIEWCGATMLNTATATTKVREVEFFGECTGHDDCPDDLTGCYNNVCDTVAQKCIRADRAAPVVTCTQATGLANNTDSVSFDTQTYCADTQLVKSVIGDNFDTTANIRETVTYTLQVHNHTPVTPPGPAAILDARDLVITDTLPADITPSSILQSDTTDAQNLNCSLIGQDISCNPFTLPEGETATVQILANVEDEPVALCNQTHSNTFSAAGNYTDTNTTPDQPTADLGVNACTDLHYTLTTPTTTSEPGDSITYTIVIDNSTGPNDMTNVVVDDDFSAISRLELVSAQITDGACTTVGQQLRCDIPSIAVGGQVTITVEALVPDVAQSCGGLATYTTSVSMDTFDTGNGPADVNSVSIPVTCPDLQVLHTVDQANAFPGDTLNYTVTMTNTGDIDQTTVQMADSVPDNYTINSFDATESDGTTDHTCSQITDTNNIVCGFDTIPVGESATVTINVTLDPLNANCGVGIEHPVAVTSAEGDRNVAPDTLMARVSTDQCADLEITTFLAGDPPLHGNQIRIAVRVHNHGPNNAENVIIDDRVPAGMRVVDITGLPLHSCTIDADEGGYYCEYPFITPNTAALPFFDVILEEATACGLNSYNTNVSMSTREAPEATADSTLVEIDVQCLADLDVQITPPASAEPGADAVFLVDVTNLGGPSRADQVELRAVLPAGVTFVDAHSQSLNCTGTPPAILCDVVSLTPNETHQVELTVQYDATTCNTSPNITVIGSTSTNEDGNTANNTAVDSVLVSGCSDLHVVKDVTPVSPVPGDLITYRMTVTNNGPFEATGLWVEDNALPPAFSWQETRAEIDGGSTNVNCTETYPSIACNFIDPLPVGQSAVVEIDVTIPNTDSVCNTQYNNTVTVLSDITDTNLTADTEFASFSMGECADLQFNKFVNTANPRIGESIQYTLQVQNNSDAEVRDIIIEDTDFPIEFTATAINAFINDVPTNAICTLDPAPSCEFIEDLFASSDRASVTIDVDIPADETLCGQSFVNLGAYSSHLLDRTEENDDPSVSVSIDACADIHVQKTVDNDTPNPGETIRYTITVSNNSAITDLGAWTLSDTLPAGLTVTAVDDADCAFDASTVTCPFTDLVAQDVKTVNIDATVEMSACDSTLTNDVQIVTSLVDTNVTADAPSVSVQVPPCSDLALTKTVDNSSPAPGESIIYTLELQNLGPDEAYGIVIEDLNLPPAFTWIDTRAFYNDIEMNDANVNCTNAYPAVSCELDVDLPQDENVSLEIEVQVPDDPALCGQTFDNTGAFMSESYDTEETADAPTASVTVIDCADIETAKTVDNATPIAGTDTITYTLSVTNHGAADAGTWTLQDIAPAGVTFATVSDDVNCTLAVDGSQIDCSFTEMLPGTTSINITADIDAASCGQTIVNDFTIVPSILDSNVTADTPSITIDTARCTEIALVKTVDNTTPALGETVNYTFTVSNEDMPYGIGDYTESLSMDIAEFVSDASGVAYSTSDDTLYVVRNQQEAIIQIDLQGNYLRTITLNGFDDTEAITSMGGDRYAIIEEKISEISYFDILDTTTEITKGAIEVTTIPLTNIPIRDDGAEGLAYDSEADVFYVIHEGGIEDMSLHVCPNDILNPQCMPVFDPEQVLPPIAVTIGDIYFDTAIDHLYFLADADGGRAIIETDLTGLVIGYLNIDQSTIDDPEGMTFSPDKSQIFTVGEPTSFAVFDRPVAEPAITDIELTDTLPAGIAFIDPPAPAECRVTGDDDELLSCDVDPLEAGQEHVMTLEATLGTDIALCGQTLPNSASVDILGRVIDSDQADITVANCSDIEVTFTADKTEVHRLETVTYTLTVTNHSPTPADGIIITNTAPSELTYVSEDSDTCDIVADVLTCTFDQLTATETVLLVTEVKDELSSCGETVLSQLQLTTAADDVGLTDDDLEESVDVACDGYSISNTVDVPEPTIDDTVVFTVGIDYQAPDADIARSTQLASLLASADDILTATIDVPDSIVVSSVTPVDAGWDCSATLGNTIVCTHLLLDATGGLSLEIEGSVTDNQFCSGDRADTIDVPAILSMTDVAQIVRGEETASIVVRCADVEITRHDVDNDTPSVGDTLTYTVEMTNNGPFDADPSVLDHIYADHLTFVSATAERASEPGVPISCIENVGSVTCGLGSLAVSDTVTLTVEATVNDEGRTCEATFENRAEAAVQLHDPDLANNIGTREVTVSPCGDLILTKTADSDTPSLGDDVVYTVSLTNNTDAPLLNITLNDVAVEGLTLTAVPAECGAITPVDTTSTVSCTLPLLDPGADNAIDLQFTASVSTDLQFCDTPLANTVQSIIDGDNGTLTTYVKEVTPMCGADLVMNTLTVDDGSVPKGSRVKYAATFTNTGPNDADGARITLTPPAGLSIDNNIATMTTPDDWDCSGSSPSALLCTKPTSFVSGVNAILGFDALVSDSLDPCASAIALDATVSIDAVTPDPDSSASSNSKSVSVTVECQQSNTNTNTNTNTSSTNTSSSSSSSSSSNNGGGRRGSSPSPSRTPATSAINIVTIPAPAPVYPVIPVQPIPRTVHQAAPVAATPEPTPAPVSTPVRTPTPTPAPTPAAPTPEPAPALPETVVSPAPSVTFRAPPPPFCGDGILNPDEECDAGFENSDSTPNMCRTNCQIAFCGDGVTDSGEECDGGGECTSRCTKKAVAVAQVTSTPAPPAPPPPPVAQVQVSPIHAPVGDTGPAALMFIALGAAGGIAAMRRRKRM